MRSTTVLSRHREDDLEYQIAIANEQAQRRDAAFAWECAQVNAAIGCGALITLPIAQSGGPFSLRGVCLRTQTYHCTTVPGGEASHLFALYDDHLWKAVLDQANVARHPFFVRETSRWRN